MKACFKQKIVVRDTDCCKFRDPFQIATDPPSTKPNRGTELAQNDTSEAQTRNLGPQFLEKTQCDQKVAIWCKRWTNKRVFLVSQRSAFSGFGPPPLQAHHGPRKFFRLPVAPAARSNAQRHASKAPSDERLMRQCALQLHPRSAQ